MLLYDCSLTSDLVNLFSNPHSHDGWLCQVSFRSYIHYILTAPRSSAVAEKTLDAPRNLKHFFKLILRHD